MFEDYRMLLLNWCNVALLNCNGGKHRLNRSKCVNLVTESGNCVIRKNNIRFTFVQYVHYYLNYLTPNAVDPWLGRIIRAPRYHLH
jgi:hypothetical protein